MRDFRNIYKATLFFSYYYYYYYILKYIYIYKYTLFNLIMRENKTISISHEMIYMLKKEPNASKLIDDLLQDHYSDSIILKRKYLLQKIGRLKEKKKEIEDLEKKLDKDFEELQCQTDTTLKEDGKSTPSATN